MGLRMRSLTVGVVMTAAIRVVMGLRMRSLTVGVVMTAAICMVTGLRMRSLTVGVVMTAAICMVMGRLRHAGGTLKSHFMQFFTIQRHSGMVATGGLYKVITAAVFAAGGGVMMFLLSRKHRSKPQR